MLQKILVPLDGSKLAEQALPYAQSLTEKFEAELILLMVLQPPILPVLAEPYSGASMLDYPPHEMEKIKEEAQAYLNNLCQKLEQDGVSARTEILEGTAVADAIVDLARQEAVDVIVKTTHGRSGLSRWIYGNVATRVLQEAHCPIFLVRVKE